MGNVTTDSLTAGKNITLRGKHARVSQRIPKTEQAAIRPPPPLPFTHPRTHPPTYWAQRQYLAIAKFYDTAES